MAFDTIVYTGPDTSVPGMLSTVAFAMLFTQELIHFTTREVCMSCKVNHGTYHESHFIGLYKTSEFHGILMALQRYVVPMNSREAVATHESSMGKHLLY